MIEIALYAAGMALIFAELFVPGRVRTATWVERIGRTSLAMRQRIHGDAGLAAVRAHAGARDLLTRGRCRV